MTIPNKIEGLIGPDGYEWMAERAERMTSIVEVGSWQGAGTLVLCTACPGTVWAVDHWQGSPAATDATHNPKFDVHATFLENVGHFPNLRILRMPSAEAAATFRVRSVDMVVIDAGHDAPSVDLDIALWFPVCKTLFCGHDWTHGPVRAAVERLGRPVEHHPSDMWSVRCDG